MAVLLVDRSRWMLEMDLRLCLAQGWGRRGYLRYVPLATCSSSSSKLGLSSISYLPLSSESNVELSEILS
jgi:hypothetical protein